MAETPKYRNYGTRLFLGLLAVVFIGGLIFILRPTPLSHVEMESVFNGWVYGQEDQKVACTALAKAGLSEYRWDRGKLSVSRRDKNKYESALAENKAFPKAPSDVKREALREMSQFESSAKTRLRDLYSAAWQLEQTIGLSEQVGYATVGVRSRIEQNGFVQKNVVTASIGVWPREEDSLSPELLSAITVSTRHHLGITDNENISIIDLRRGCSWLGTNEGIANAPETFRIRQERFWEEKVKSSFPQIDGIRVIATTIPHDEGRTGDTVPTLTPSKSFAQLGNRVASTFVSSYPAPRYSEKSPTEVVSKMQLASEKSGDDLLTPMILSISVPDTYIKKVLASKNIFCAGQEEYQARQEEVLADVRQQIIMLLQPIYAFSRYKTTDLTRLVHVTTASEELLLTSTSANSVTGMEEKRVTEPNISSPALPPSTLTLPTSVSSDVPTSSAVEKISLKEQLFVFWQKNSDNPVFWGIICVAVLLPFLLRAARQKKVVLQDSTSPTDDPPYFRMDDIEDTFEPHSLSLPNSESWSNLETEVQLLVRNNPQQAADIIQRWIQTGT